MEITTIILILAAIIVAYIILSKLFKKKRWIYQRDVETPRGKSKLYFVEGYENMFNSLKSAENFARTKR